MREHEQVDYSFIVPAYNEEEYLPETLSSLRSSMEALGEFSGEIVVTDNNSSDRTAAIAGASGAKVIFERHRQISRARNAGARASSGRYLIFVDSDTTISPTLLNNTLTALESGACCGGGTVPEFDGYLPLLAKVAHKAWVFLSTTFRWACGAYIFCTREAYVETGGFDERYYASEEIHFSRALQRWGKKKGKTFDILKDPIFTSNRKIVWYSTAEILRMSFGMLLHSKPLRNKDACYEMWYRHPPRNDRMERPIHRRPNH